MENKYKHRKANFHFLKKCAFNWVASLCSHCVQKFVLYGGSQSSCEYLLPLFTLAGLYK